MPSPISLDRKFTDFSFAFNKHPVTKDLVKVTNENAIKNSVKNIIKTRLGERPFNSSFGSRVYSLLFENYSPSLDVLLKSEIESALLTYEPRINIIKIVVIEQKNENGLLIEILFSLLNSPNPISVDIILERIR